MCICFVDHAEQLLRALCLEKNDHKYDISLKILQFKSKNDT